MKAPESGCRPYYQRCTWDYEKQRLGWRVTCTCGWKRGENHIRGIRRQWFGSKREIQTAWRWHRMGGPTALKGGE